MDFSLRCNSLKCRTQLTDYAVVTTCSHIYCIPCSEASGLGRSDGSARVCPACDTQLPNPDDAVRTQLNPTEDYKTSVLSGFSPTVIMECAGRGLAFYSYQTAQEIIYQEFLARSLTDKYSTLSTQMDQIIHDANAEITNLRDKLKSMQLEQKNLEQKCDKLAHSCREKERTKNEVTNLYNKLKQKHRAAGLEVAADYDAENVLEAANYNNAGGRDDQVRVSRAGSNGSRGSGGHPNPANLWPNRVEGSRAGLQSARSAPVLATPSGHRTRLPRPMYGNGGYNQAVGGNTVHAATPHRSALHNLNPNVIYGNGHNGSYGGLGIGVKAARPPNGLISRSGYGAGRPSGLGGPSIR